MKKVMVFLMLAMVCLLGLNACACHLLPEKVVYSPGVVQKMEELDIPVAVLVSKKGTVAAYDSEGKILEFCSAPQKDQSAAQDLRDCPGLSDDKKILFVQKLKITGSQGSFCITFEDIHGRAQTFCIPPQ